jgi:hypothetical protein
MPNTVGGYWGTQQFARDLPLPVLYTTSTGLSFQSPVFFDPPYGMVAGDTLIIICTIRMHGGESEMASITSVPAGYTLVCDHVYPPPWPNPSHLYVYRKEITDPAAETTYYIHRSGPTTPYTVTNKALTGGNLATLTIPTHTMNVNDGILVALSPADARFDGQYNVSAKTATTISYATTGSNISTTATGGTVDKSPSVGFMNASAHAIRGAGPIESFVNESMVLPHYVPAITTTKPNTLLLMGYSAKAPLDETINMSPNEVLWYGSGGAYFGQHWNTYERNALIPGTYGPTSIVIANTERDQYTVLSVAPKPAPPTPFLTSTALSPASGVIAGGTTVTVTGTSFAVGATSVRIGATTIAAGSVTVTSGTTLTFVTPAGPGGVVSVQPVSVIVGAYESEPVDFTYNATGGFSPASLPKMQFWLDSSEASTLSLSGSTVTQWRDLGTKRYIFNAPTGEYHSEPTYTEDIGGLTTMLWAADHFMATTLLASSGGKPRTICWVMDPDPAGGDGPPGFSAPGQHGLFLPALMEISATGTLVVGPEGTFDTGIDALGLHVWTVLFDSYRSQIWKDGVSVWAGNRGTNMPQATPLIGSHSHHHYHFSGVMPEWAVFHATLTTTQRQAMETYLTNKWAGGPYVPTAPTLVSAVPGNTQITLTWTAPSSSGGATITDYDIEVSANGTTGWTAIAPDTSGTGLSYTVTGLTNGVIRYYRVKAENSVGLSAASNVLSTTPFLPTAPGAPTLNSATAGNTTVALAWTAGTAGTSATTGYLIEWSANGTTGWSTVTTTGVVLTYTDTGLTNGTIRYYRVSGINPVGTGTASNVLSATPSVLFPTIAAQDITEKGTSMGTQAITMPTGIVAGNLLISIAASDLNGSAGTHTPSTGWTEIRTQLQGSNVVRLSAFGRIADGTGTDNLTITGPSQDYCAWTARITQHTVVSILDIQVADTTNSTGNADPPNLNPGTARAWLWLAAEAVDLTTGNTITSVPSGYTEQYRDVSASSTSSVALGVGSKTGDTTSENPGTFTNNPTTRPWVAFTIGVPNLAVAPSAPTLTTATPGDTAVTLTWTAGATGGSAITDYTVQYRTTAGPGSWNTFSHSASAATTIAVTGLTNNTGYDFQVAAVNPLGPSSYSATMSATPVPPSGGVIVYQETYTGADGTPWANKTSGPPAAGLTYLENGAKPTIQGNRGAWVTGSGAYNEVACWCGVDEPTPTAVQITFDTQASTTSIGGWQSFTFCRASLHYGVELENGGGWSFHRSGTNQATGTLGFALTSSTVLHWKVERLVNVVRGRWWADASPEPSTWHFEWTDPSPLPGGGLLMTHKTGGSGGVITYYVDDIIVKNMA